MTEVYLAADLWEVLAPGFAPWPGRTDEGDQ